MMRSLPASGLLLADPRKASALFALLFLAASPQALAQGAGGAAKVEHASIGAEAAVAQAEAAAGRLDMQALEQAARRWTALADTDRLRAARLWSVVAGAAFARDDYRAAAAAALHWQKALPAADGGGDAAAAANLLSIAKLLSPAPVQRVEDYAPVTISVHEDGVGLSRARLKLNGKDAEAVLDTGANLSTASETAARELGLRFIEGDASVGSATNAAVSTRLAVADRLVVAGVTLSNVVFLILPDEHLRLPVPDYRLDLIIGFPVFRALQRVTYSRSGTFTPARSHPIAGPRNLKYEGSTIFVEAEIASKPLWMHLDTGARATSLPASFAKENETITRNLERRTVRVGGAGGVIEQQVAILPEADVRIDGRTVKLSDLAIAVTRNEQSSTTIQPLLGQDVLGQYDGYTIDFLAGRFVVENGKGN